MSAASRRDAQQVRRLRLARAVTGAALATVALRLVQLQGLDAPAYASAAEKQRLREVTLAASRGDLLDRSGQVLATTVRAAAVYADPRFVKDPAAAAALLAPLLDVPQATLRARLSRATSFTYLARGLDPAAADAAVAAALRAGLRGVGALPERKRLYPEGALAADLTGLVNREGTPLDGLEASLDPLLRGTDGLQRYEISPSGARIPTGFSQTRPPVDGTAVQLTIDRDVQWMAQQAIAAQVKRTGAASGTVIVMDPRSGELLAVATAPSYDPGDPSTIRPSLLGDRAVSEVYEPGSTNKLITAAAALDAGVVTPDSEVTVPPQLALAGHVFHDAEPHGTEHLTFTGVLAKSSNIGTILVSQRVGHDALHHYLDAFGFGHRVAADLPGEERGILPAAADWNATQQYTIPFGQGVSVTAMQTATVYATVADGGVRMTPHVVRGTLRGGRFTPRQQPAGRRVIAPATAATLRAMLEAVTSDQGTAPAARIPGYRVAGKTGTSQRVDPACGCYRGYTSSFVGFAPADDPQLLVEVVLQAPTRGHFGGEVAAPVFHDVMAFALQRLGVLPTGTRPPVMRLSYDGRG